THAEMQANGWQPGAFLVEAPEFFEGVRDGRESVQMLVPVHLGAAVPLDLNRLKTEQGPEFIEMSGATGSSTGPDEVKAQVRGGVVVFHSYVSRFRKGVDGHDYFGFLATGISVEGDRQVVVDGHVERQDGEGPRVDA